MSETMKRAEGSDGEAGTRAKPCVSVRFMVERQNTRRRGQNDRATAARDALTSGHLDISGLHFGRVGGARAMGGFMPPFVTAARRAPNSAHLAPRGIFPATDSRAHSARSSRALRCSMYIFVH